MPVRFCCLNKDVTAIYNSNIRISKIFHFVRGNPKLAFYMESMRRKKKPYIPITDDFMFKSVFKDPVLLKQLLIRTLPDTEIGELKQVRTEDVLKLFNDMHGIKLDVSANTDKQMFNVEMQNRIAKFPCKRARYSGDMIDVNSLPKGVLYHKLKDCYVIVISPQDPFGEDEIVYVSEQRIRKSGKPAKEGKYVIYINCSGTNGRDAYPDLVPFCEYVMGNKTDDSFVNAVNEKVRDYNSNSDWRLEHMEWEMRRLELIEEGFEEGMSVGEKRGEKRGIRKTLKRAVRTQFRSLLELGVNEERALQTVCKDYPEFSDSAIRKILNMNS